MIFNQNSSFFVWLYFCGKKGQIAACTWKLPQIKKDFFVLSGYKKMCGVRSTENWPGVNFTNILRAHFLYKRDKSFACSFFVFTCILGLNFFLAQEFSANVLIKCWWNWSQKKKKICKILTKNRFLHLRRSKKIAASYYIVFAST